MSVRVLCSHQVTVQHMYWQANVHESHGAAEPMETLSFAPQAKNAALKEAGAVVPESFEGLEGTIGRVYQQLVADGVITPRPEPTPPSVPQDLSAAKKAGKVHCADHRIS